MADIETHSQIKIVKNSKILVNVEEALQDILVVSYAFENKLYQGVLLDSTKKHLPCGVSPPAGFLQTDASLEEDKLFSLGQRFTYFQEKSPAHPTPPSTKNNVELQPFHLRRTIRPPARYKNSRMTVRLRPRQVLCSKCRSICNENSENVDLSRKRKGSTQPTGADVPSSKSPRPLFSENQRDNQPTELRPTLIPKIPRLQPTEISNALSGNKLKYWEDHETSDSKERMVLRKKRSVGSMEDLWDESVFEDNMRKDAERKARNARTTPVIKISFGSQGEGTVLKIPAKVQNYIPSESETETDKKTKDASAKAAKRALKKAKKEARRKMLGGGSPAYEALYHRKHKHKVKHKKKHKEERRHSKELEAIKERCLKQKLSISLKRLNANAYYLGSNGSKSPATSSCSNSESSDDHGETVPDFPSSHPLMMRISTQSVTDCVTRDGRRMSVGDVVWGKIHGFPWWPGKVASISISRKDDGASLAPQAHVTWYGSSTSSLMPCDQLSPFLETFKTRYNKKKRGPYKEAIKQASNEARGVNVVS
ncbi:hypothetical protein L9F63_004737 [Diploptera punctata]|uniref:PWWP domain-containing protein n=1 Tax=Diploptera punctata TaxID=6984 RepID=A0AAD8E7J3_DIPPU|nr:hypothetical protein L9F63_004737 [Diploptera punctata]